MVQDQKNALLLRPSIPLDKGEMATLQHALIRSIQIVFDLEEGELLGEPLPSRDNRNTILLFEATEGGAGVLNRLVADPEKIKEVATRALTLMHYQAPFDHVTLKDADDACVAGCYRCIFSYFNQPDHELIDRRHPKVSEFLLALTQSTAKGEDHSATDDAWSSALQKWAIPRPTSLDLVAGTKSYFWPSRDVLAVVGALTDEVKSKAVERGILEIIELPLHPGDQPPSNLIAALGILI
jgi:hypothetical protein